MSGTCRSLIEVLDQVQDPRKARGKRHPMTAVLALAVVATLCGAKGYAAIAEWGRNYGTPLARALGFTRRKTPCGATFFNVLRCLDHAQFERALAVWSEEMLTACPPKEGEQEGIAIDGKTIRGAKQQGAINVHLLSALSHRLGLTMFQEAVPEKTNEIGAIQDVLSALVLEGRVVTVDALLCQREVARRIVEKGAITS